MTFAAHNTDVLENVVMHLISLIIVCHICYILTQIFLQATWFFLFFLFQPWQMFWSGHLLIIWPNLTRIKHGNKTTDIPHQMGGWWRESETFYYKDLCFAFHFHIITIGTKYLMIYSGPSTVGCTEGVSPWPSCGPNQFWQSLQFLHMGKLFMHVVSA